MKSVILTVLVLALMLTIGLPLYLGPDDLAHCRKPSGSGECATADAIIAISGGDTSARTAEAIKLYKAGWASRLILSGAAADKTGPSNAEVMKEQALRAGVLESSITIDEFSNTTAENAQNTAALAKEMGLKRIILVTSAYHQRRASIEFGKRLGGDVAIVNHPVSNDDQWSNWWWATPYGWWLGASEVLKIMLTETGVLL